MRLAIARCVNFSVCNENPPASLFCCWNTPLHLPHRLPPPSLDSISPFASPPPPPPRHRFTTREGKHMPHFLSLPCLRPIATEYGVRLSTHYPCSRRSSTATFDFMPLCTICTFFVTVVLLKSRSDLCPYLALPVPPPRRYGDRRESTSTWSTAGPRAFHSMSAPCPSPPCSHLSS